MTVYADILLLVNFSMDFLTLYFTGRLLHKPVVKIRYIIAALIGSAGGTVRTILSSAPSPIGAAVSGFVLSAVMVLTAFGCCGSVRNMLRDCFAVWGCGVFLGGIMTWLLSFGEPAYIDSGSISFLPLVIVCFTVSSAAMRFLAAHRYKKSADVCVHVCGSQYSFTALYDSGNLASDPLSGLPVVIVRRGILTEAENELGQSDCSLAVRVIPLKGIGGESVNIGFIPERILVDGCERRAVVLIMNDSGGFAGFDGILPAALC